MIIIIIRRRIRRIRIRIIIILSLVRKESGLAKRMRLLWSAIY